jgi:very-short-patch-repair endonuclease
VKCKTNEIVLKSIFILEMNGVAKYQQIAIQKGGLLLSTSAPKGKKLQWQCRDGHTFWLTAYKIHRSGKWCPICGASIGERNVRATLQGWNIPFSQQAILPILPRRKFDFYFEYQGRKILLEVDGQQHMNFVRKFHKNKAKFVEAQIVDRVKTYCALQSGFYLIRIDYTQINNVAYHIATAIGLGCPLYLSDPILYKYISDIPLTQEQYQQFFAK